MQRVSGYLALLPGPISEWALNQPEPPHRKTLRDYAGFISQKLTSISQCHFVAEMP